MLEKFKKLGILVTRFAPLQLGEPSHIHTFRIGLFGIDKLRNPDETLKQFSQRLDNLEYINSKI
jgi:hypothetical protein